MSNLVIAIDGPAGAGKTTVAKTVANQLGLSFLDTGAMYRCVALLALRNGLSADSGERAADLAAKCQISFEARSPQRVILDGEDVSEAIRTPEVGDFASEVSVHSPVRRVLVEQQKEIVSHGGVILEGRDTTTVVAPKADLKIYLTASIEVRAQRRFKELRAKGISVDLGEIKRQIRERDERDCTRLDSPLRVAEDAVVVDTDVLTPPEVVARVIELASRLPA